jgi:glycosyltransferase involved in cell wall biosynthesis
VIENILEILLITYNRSSFLDNTLRQLKDSPFAKCKITLLDNSSTDDTPEVCGRYADTFPNYTVIRHKKNIGGNPNYLRAVELSSSIYTWVLCDDDDFDFSDISDVIDALEDKIYDFIYLGSPYQFQWERGLKTTSTELIKRGARYYGALSYMPAIIFRTELFDDECILKGYRLVDNLYPNFELLNKSVRNNFKIHVAKHLVFKRNDVNSSGFSPLFWYTAWVNCCQTIQDKTLRARTIDQATDLRGFFKSLAFWIALEKTYRHRSFWKQVTDIMFGLSFRQRLKFLMLLPVIIIPIPIKVLLRARETAYKIIGNAETLPPVELDKRN